MDVLQKKLTVGYTSDGKLCYSRKEGAMPATTNKPTILIVDDAPDIVDLLKRALGFAGYEVIAATNGIEALGFVALYPQIGAILLDLNMPHMDGVAFVQELERQGLRRCPIAIITASTAAVAKERLASIHADALFLKPFHLMDVLNTLARIVSVSA